MIPTLINTNNNIKFTGKYPLIISPSTAIPERLPTKNICEISSHILLYRFKYSYDCQNSVNPCLFSCICYFLIESVIISRIYQPVTKSHIPYIWNFEEIEQLPDHMKAYFTRLLNHLSDEYACLAEASYDAGIERGYSREEAYEK